MNGKDIFIGLKYVGEDLVEEAEYGSFPGSEKKKASGIRTLGRKPLLIAAIIGLMLFLMGCAWVVMKMQDLKLGEQAVTQDVFEYDPNTGEAISQVGQETYTQQILTLSGMNGTPASMAAREWYEFCKSYDPDRAIQKSVWGNYPDFPAEYSGYGLYTQDMKDKLDEILAKYDLKLRGAQIRFPTSKQLLQALGMEKFTQSKSGAKIRIDYSTYYENGNLDLYFEITLPGETEAKTNCYLFYRPKDCLIPDTAVLTEAKWEEWNYTTSSGAEVLIVRSEETSSAWIFCDMENQTASVRLDAVQKLYEETEDGVPVAQFTVLSKAQLEQIADSIDFSLEPELVDGWENLPDNAVPAGQEINGYCIAPVSSFTDGYSYRIVLKVTAPEGVALTDPDDHTARIEAGDGVYGYSVEDGDGKRNTCHFILSESMEKENCPDDGTYPYPEGNVIPVCWEDLYFVRYDLEKSERIVNLLTEGTWKFNVPLNTSDTREVELLTGPITAKACTGWKMDGTDAYEERQITSIKLRAMSIDLTSETKEYAGDFLCFTGQCSYIVMKDGSWVEMYGYALDQPIDLDQVAYVQLADETIIPMPGVDEETVTLISGMVKAEWEEAYVPEPVFEDGIELLKEPIILQSLAGYVTDPSGYMEMLYEDIRITSIILHPDGLVLKGPEAFDSPDNQATVVLKDGTEILLTGMGGSPYCDERMSQLAAESTIDLSTVDHVILPDGTKLNMP